MKQFKWESNLHTCDIFCFPNNILFQKDIILNLNAISHLLHSNSPYVNDSKVEKFVYAKSAGNETSLIVLKSEYIAVCSCLKHVCMLP